MKLRSLLIFLLVVLALLPCMVDTALSDLLNRFDKLKNRKKQQMQEREAKKNEENAKKTDREATKDKRKNVQKEGKNADNGKDAAMSSKDTHREEKATKTIDQREREIESNQSTKEEDNAVATLDEGMSSAQSVRIVDRNTENRESIQNKRRVSAKSSRTKAIDEAGREKTDVNSNDTHDVNENIIDGNEKMAFEGEGRDFRRHQKEAERQSVNKKAQEKAITDAQRRFAEDEDMLKARQEAKADIIVAEERKAELKEKQEAHVINQQRQRVEDEERRGHHEEETRGKDAEIKQKRHEQEGEEENRRKLQQRRQEEEEENRRKLQQRRQEEEEENRRKLQQQRQEEEKRKKSVEEAIKNAQVKTEVEVDGRFKDVELNTIDMNLSSGNEGPKQYIDKLSPVLSQEEKVRLSLEERRNEQRKQLSEAERRRLDEVAKEKKRRIEALLKRQEQMEALEKTGNFNVQSTKAHTSNRDVGKNNDNEVEKGKREHHVQQTWVERARNDRIFADEYRKKDGELIMIDFSCLTTEVYGINCQEEEIRNLADEWNLAMTTEGFVLIKGHGIRQELFLELDKAWEDFFNQDEKMKLKYRYGNHGNDQGGYTPIGEETSSDGKNQHVESYSFNRNVINYLKSSKLYRTKISSEYFHALETLLNKIHVLTARSLGIEDQHFFDKYYASTSSTSKNVLKIANYPSRPLTESIDGVVYSEHTDKLGFSILCLPQDDRSLQFKNEIKNKFSAWLTVDMKKSTQEYDTNVSSYGSVLFVHAGDLISKWTNGYYKSIPHRVVLEPGNSSVVGRRSMVFYSGPNEDLGVDNSLDQRKGVLPLTYLIERAAEHLQ